MTRKIIFSQIIFLLMLLVFAGCKKHKEKFLGAETAMASKDFYVAGNKFEVWRKIVQNGQTFFLFINTAGTNTHFSFANTSSQYYKARLSERVSWKFEITCFKTGAQKVVAGISDSINIDNSIWDGSTTTDLFFNAADTLEVKLSFAGSNLVLRDTLVIITPKTYGTLAATSATPYIDAQGVNYWLVDDFEGTTTATSAFSPFYIDQADLGGNNFGNNGFTGNKVQGSFSYQMYGTDINNNTYLGSSNTPTLNDFPVGKSGYITTTNPDSLYINMYIYGFNKPNTTISVLAYEKDDPNQLAGKFDKTKNDIWIFQQSVDWSGWKLVSIPYRAFHRPKPATSTTGLGNNTLNPDRLSGLVLELDSYPTQGFEVEALVDMVVLTENGVFNK